MILGCAKVSFFFTFIEPDTSHHKPNVKEDSPSEKPESRSLLEGFDETPPELDRCNPTIVQRKKKKTRISSLCAHPIGLFYANASQY